MMPHIPKKFCKQSISLIIESETRDRFGKPIMKASQQDINNVLVQEQTIYSGTNNNREVTANAVIFLFDAVTTPMPKLDKNCLGKKLSYKDKEWTITNLVTNYYPTSPDKIYSYEIEVL